MRTDLFFNLFVCFYFQNEFDGVYAVDSPYFWVSF